MKEIELFRQEISKIIEKKLHSFRHLSTCMLQRLTDLHMELKIKLMQITAHYSTKTGTIKQAFSRMFPYLKIEFIKEVTDHAGSAVNTSMILHNRYLGEINERLKTGTIEISDDYKASNVEELFKKNFGLPIQVFRKEKKRWVPAVAEEFTLAEENEIGKESCIVLS